MHYFVWLNVTLYLVLKSYFENILGALSLSSLSPFAEYGFNGGILTGCFVLIKFTRVSSILSSNVN